MGRENYKGIILLLLVLVGCVKDKPNPPNNTVPSDKHGVYVVCEGQFTAGNGSLYLYHPAADSVYGDLYTAANGNSAGDVLQSMTRIGDYLFLAVNNSNKVAVVAASGLKLVANISIPYPRYILQAAADKAYVSSLYSNKVYVINTVSFAVIDSIAFPHTNTERMCLSDGAAFVCTWDTACSSIYKVDVNANKVIQAISLAGRAPHDILVDKEQMIWVLSGNRAKGKQSTWTRVDPSTGEMLASYTFPLSAEPIKPALNPKKDTIYFIGVNYMGGVNDNGIYRMGIHDAALPTLPLVQGLSYQYFWALGIDPVTGYIYVGDPKGFNQKGSVSVYKTDISKVSTFNVGVGPSQFYFDN